MINYFNWTNLEPDEIRYTTSYNYFLRYICNIVDLVTFLRNKYMAVEGVKIGSRTWKKWNGIYSTNLECIFNILSIWEKVYFRVFLWCFYVYFDDLRVNIGGFESFSPIWGMFKVQKYKFQTKLVIENFRSILFWSENIDSGVKLDTSNLSNSQSNQNDLTHLIVLLVQFPKISKSVLSKGPNDCFLEFDKTESQYIENWTSNLS